MGPGWNRLKGPSPLPISTSASLPVGCLAATASFITALTDAATLKFGSLEPEENTLLDIPAAIFIGGVCGCLGAFFIFVNINLSIMRKKYINTNCKRIVEAIFFAGLTSTVFFLAVLARRDNCKP